MLVQFVLMYRGSVLSPPLAKAVNWNTLDKVIWSHNLNCTQSPDRPKLRRIRLRILDLKGSISCKQVRTCGHFCILEGQTMGKLRIGIRGRKSGKAYAHYSIPSDHCSNSCNVVYNLKIPSLLEIYNDTFCIGHPKAIRIQL